jgi:hypothetical protein
MSKQPPHKSNTLSFTPEHVAAFYKREFGAAPADVMTPEQAQKWADAFATVNPSEAVAKRFDAYKGCFFIPAASAVDWLNELPLSGVIQVIQREALSGYFEEQNDEDMEDADEDGDFISTPCYCINDSFPDVLEMAEGCARGGLLIIEHPTRLRGVCTGISHG